MKILFIENNLAGGGAEKVLLTILESLDAPQYDITLLLIKNTGIYINKVPSYVNVKYMIDVSKENQHFPADNNVLKKYYQEEIGNDYDIEIAFLEGPPTKLLSFSTNTRSIKIAWVHIDLQKVHWTYSYYKSLEEELNAYKMMNYVIFVSENAKNGFEQLFHTSLSNSIIIKNPIDLKKINLLANEYKIEYKGFTCVIVGSLVNRKGHSRLLYAMGHLFDIGYHFHLYIIGEGSEKTSLMELSHLLNIADYVHFMGFLINPYPYIKKADLLISSSIAEGYPLVSCEALALSTPIMATDCTGNRDVLKNGTYGMLVDNSERGIFEGLKKILDDHSLYDTLKQKASWGVNEICYTERISQIKELFQEKMK